MVKGDQILWPRGIRSCSQSGSNFAVKMDQALWSGHRDQILQAMEIEWCGQGGSGVSGKTDQALS